MKRITLGLSTTRFLGRVNEDSWVSRVKDDGSIETSEKYIEAYLMTGEELELVRAQLQKVAIITVGIGYTGSEPIEIWPRMNEFIGFTKERAGTGTFSISYIC